VDSSRELRGGHARPGMAASLGHRAEREGDRPGSGRTDRQIDLETLAKELDVGALTLKDILAQLAGLDAIRARTCPPPVFKRGVMKIEDLAAGMELTGTVLNVVDSAASSTSACTTAAWSTSAGWPTSSSAIRTTWWRWATSSKSGSRRSIRNGGACR